MKECELRSSCNFFASVLRDKPSTAQLFRERYCNNEGIKCARFILYKNHGVKELPDDLFPNQTERIRLFRHEKAAQRP